MDYKMLFISLLTICMIGCRKDQVYTMRCLRITDYKPYSDSLYKAEGGYNVREIKFYYSLPNHSNKPIYVPLRTWFRKNVSSEIKVFFGAPDKPCGVVCADVNPKTVAKRYMIVQK